ncbi:hypothetical protein C8R44DRAFT_928112 [Mycena epipterygia]|nr:hypothetical protein C8R44DRAFT_928112 [Mycena epipterygia]
MFLGQRHVRTLPQVAYERRTHFTLSLGETHAEGSYCTISINSTTTPAFWVQRKSERIIAAIKKVRWQKERQFQTLNDKKEKRGVKVIRGGFETVVDIKKVERGVKVIRGGVETVVDIKQVVVGDIGLSLPNGSIMSKYALPPKNEANSGLRIHARRRISLQHTKKGSLATYDALRHPTSTVGCNGHLSDSIIGRWDLLRRPENGEFAEASDQRGWVRWPSIGFYNRAMGLARDGLKMENSPRPPSLRPARMDAMAIYRIL